jgi:replicative DNA helicase
MESREQTEKAVIGSILLDGAAAMAEAINHGMDEDWFNNMTLRRIYNECLSLFVAAKPIDSYSIGMKLGKDDREVLLSTIDDTITSANASHYIELLNMHRQYQRAVLIADTSKRRLEKVHPAESMEVIDHLKTQWSGIGGVLRKTKQIGDLAMEKVEDWMTPPDQRAQKVVWPLEKLNTIIGGLTNELVFVVAAESVGKTALVNQTLLANEKVGMAGYVASLESTAKRLVPRFISNIARINTLKIEHGFYTQEMMDRARAAAEYLKTVSFNINDSPMTLEQLHAWAKISVQNGAKFLVVDNTRHIIVNGIKDDVARYSAISAKLTQIRNDVQVPVIALHHANQKGDVSWSQDFRRDGDILLILTHNEGMSRPGTDDDKFQGYWVVDFTVAKNRDGRKGMTIPFEFYKEHQKFMELNDSVEGLDR